MEQVRCSYLLAKSRRTEHVLSQKGHMTRVCEVDESKVETFGQNLTFFGPSDAALRFGIIKKSRHCSASVHLTFCPSVLQKSGLQSMVCPSPPLLPLLRSLIPTSHREHACPVPWRGVVLNSAAPSPNCCHHPLIEPPNPGRPPNLLPRRMNLAGARSP